MAQDWASITGEFCTVVEVPATQQFDLPDEMQLNERF